MYYHHYGYGPHVNQYANYPYRDHPYMPQHQQAYDYYNPFYPADPGETLERQQSFRGQATWTEGGPVTECGIPWSNNNYMTAAVGADSPYQCGQTLRIRNLSSPDHKEITVKVVDEVANYPSNWINLHRRAFIALGASPQVGVIHVEISPLSETGQGEWGAYLSEVIQTAFPGYEITGYHPTGKTELTATETQETFAFMLQSPQETINIEGIVHYHPSTGRIISVELKEV